MPTNPHYPARNLYRSVVDSNHSRQLVEEALNWQLGTLMSDLVSGSSNLYSKQFIFVVLLYSMVIYYYLYVCISVF